MPLNKIECIANKRAWGLWEIQEHEEELAEMVKGIEVIPGQLIHPNKRLEFIAGRALVKSLMTALGLTFHGIVKNEFGKPFLKDHNLQLSLSHSFPHVAALIDFAQSAGIDVEQPKEKLLRIAPRIMHATELRNAGQDMVKHCVYWCAKEALVKIHGKKDLIFAENLQIEPFELRKEGIIIGRIIVDNTTTTCNLKYLVQQDFVVVYNE